MHGTASKRKAANFNSVNETTSPSGGGLPENLGSLPLRLVLVGHNPSAHAWTSGHYYR